MAGKRIGLIVSSASSGISGVVSDAKRLIPDGDFYSTNLWIRSAQTSNCHSLIADWLTEIGYQDVAVGDVNEDGQVDIADVTALIDSILSGATANQSVADVNGDGQVDIADVTSLIDTILSK